MVTAVSRLRKVGLLAFLTACLVGLSLEADPVGARPPGEKEKEARRGPPAGEALTVSGTVKEFTTAPKGEVDGFTLTDGPWVHWPPHLASRFADFVVKGDRVRV